MIMKTITVTRLWRWYFVLILKRATVSHFKNSAAVYKKFIHKENEDDWPTWKSMNRCRNPEAAYGKTSELVPVFTVVRINFEKQYLNEKTEIIIMRPQCTFRKYRFNFIYLQNTFNIWWPSPFNWALLAWNRNEGKNKMKTYRSKTVMSSATVLG